MRAPVNGLWQQKGCFIKFSGAQYVYYESSYDKSDNSLFGVFPWKYFGSFIFGMHCNRQFRQQAKQPRFVIVPIYCN